jgi:hypothetical protein
MEEESQGGVEKEGAQSQGLEPARQKDAARETGRSWEGLGPGATAESGGTPHTHEVPESADAIQRAVGPRVLSPKPDK